MSLERKLELFAKAAEDEAHRRRRDKQDIIDKRIKDELEKIKQDALENAEKKLELELYRITQSQKREIANHEALAKKRVILRRAEFLNILKAEIRNNLEQYTNTDDYREWLIKSIHDELRENPDAVVVLRPKDYEYLEIIGTTASNQIRLGGYRLVRTALAIDNTYEAKLDAIMEEFCGFNLIE